MDGLAAIGVSGGSGAYAAAVPPSHAVTAAAPLNPLSNAGPDEAGQAEIAAAPSLTASAELAYSQNLSPKLAYAPSAVPRSEKFDRRV
jgi:hypothetical protein